MADPNVAMSPEQFKQLLKSINSSSAPAVAGTPSNLGSFNTALGEAAKSVDPLKMAMGGAGKAVDGAKDGFSKLQKGVEENLNVFRDLSKSGASFSNDVVGMSVSAAQSRLSLTDFAGVIKDNAANMAGLGGNVTRGAEAFAKFSKDMFDSRVTDNLKQLGYTNKDLNEVLALQIGFGRASIREDEASRKKTIESATQLATEMDAMAKLTGKSREEQMEAAKKAQADMQVEAKFRLIGIQQGADAEKAARENFAKQYNEAQLRGQGQMFKEVFATGNIMSKDAGMQVALQGKAANATIEQARALSVGNIQKANEASARAQEETLKNQKNVGLLTLATVGSAGGDVTKAVQENMTANRTMYDSVQSQINNGAKGVKEGLDKVKGDITQAQAGQRRGEGGQYEDVSGATRAVVQLGNRAGDVTSALATQLIDPLNKKIGPGLGEFSDKYLSGVVTMRDQKGNVTGQENFAKAMEGQLKAGFEKGAGGAAGEEKPAGWKEQATKTEAFTGADAVKSIGEIAGNIGRITAQSIDSLVIDGKAIPGRSSGSLGETGSLLENFGAGTLTMLHGKEAVLTEDQLKNLAMGAKNSGVEGAIGNLKSSIDLSKVSKDISTTVSSTTGGETVTRKVQSDASKEAQEELAKLKAQYLKDRADLQSQIKAELGPDAKFKDVMKSMRESVEAQNLTEIYDKKYNELQKVISDGTSFEVEKKKEAVEEIKKTAEKSTTIPSHYNELAKSTSAMPTTGVNIDNIDFGPNGLPIFKQVKAKAAEVPSAIKSNQAQADEERSKRQAEQQRQTVKPAESAPTTAPARATEKEASLNDVVGRLESLNKLMGQLIGQNDELLNKQIKATKSGNQNIFAR